jgi:hypothetical protein
MAGIIFLTDTSGKPIPNQPINITGGLPGNPVSPESTDSNGILILIVPHAGTYGLSTLYLNKAYTNSITFNSIGIAPDLHWKLAVAAPARPISPTKIAIAIGIAAIIVIGSATAYVLIKRKPRR